MDWTGAVVRRGCMYVQPWTVVVLEWCRATASAESKDPVWFQVGLCRRAAADQCIRRNLVCGLRQGQGSGQWANDDDG